MKAYYRNALKTASLSVPGLAAGEDGADLIQQDLERTVTFTGSAAAVTASWTAQAARAADALFISNTSALQGTLKLYDQNQALARTIALQLGRWNNKIEFPPLAVGKAEITLQAPAGTALYAGLLFLSLGAALPRFAVGVGMDDALRGSGGRSDGGQSYGTAGVTLEALSLQWKRVTDGERRAMREYIDEVQLHLNHYISPYEGTDLYVTIAEAGKWRKHDGNGFYWDTDISYEEAR